MPTTVSLRGTEHYDLKALYETSQLLSGSLDLDFVLNNLLLIAMSKFLVTRGVVLLQEPLLGGYRVAAEKGISGLEKGAVLPLALAAGELDQSEIAAPEPLAAHRIDFLVPITFHQRHIGFVGLGKKATGKPFGPQELEFIRLLVNMSSTAVHNSLMVEELKQANRDLDGKIQELNTLFDLSREFNSTLDRDRLVKLLSYALMGQLLVRRYLFLLRRPQQKEENDGELQLLTSHGVRGVQLSREINDRLCELDEMILLGDASGHEGWDELRRSGFEIILPLRQQGQTCGVLCLGSKMTGQPYGAGDIELLYALGNLALVSIQNTYLVEEQIEKERLEEEMRLAREIQQKLLPQEIPPFPDLEISTLAIPNRQVGGDYFDVCLLKGPRLLVAVADVTGKGVPASLLMANLQACLRVLLPIQMTLEEATASINAVICENTNFDKFITFFWGIYDPAERTLDFVNAGHNPPVQLSADGRITLLEAGGLLLGIFKSAPYERGTTRLEPGDVVTLFTDGVTEAMNAASEEYGDERLQATLLAHRHESAEQILNAVREDVQRFIGDTPLSDDLTMVVLKAK